MTDFVSKRRKTKGNRTNTTDPELRKVAEEAAKRARLTR